MTRYPFLDSAQLSTNDLDAIYHTLTRTPLRGKGSATRAKALARVTKQLDLATQENSLDNILEVLPALVKNQGFYRQGDHLAAALAEQAAPATETEETAVTDPIDQLRDETPGADGFDPSDEDTELTFTGDEPEIKVELDVIAGAREIAGTAETDEVEVEAESEGEPAPGFVTEAGAAEAEAEAGDESETETEADPAIDKAKAVAIAELQAATNELNAAKAALRAANARYTEARAAAKPYLKRGGGTTGHKAGTGALPREGSADHVLLGLLERPEGVTQAQLKAVLPKYNSAAYHSERLGAKLSRTVTVEGEGKARVFRFAKA